MDTKVDLPVTERVKLSVRNLNRSEERRVGKECA